MINVGLYVLVMGLVEAAGLAHPAPFAMSAQVIEAIEGGPLAIKITLRPTGEQPLSAYWSEGGPQTSLVPASWHHCLRLRIVNGTGIDFHRFTKRAPISEILYLHHDYAGITAGSTDLKITWPLYKDRGLERLLAKPTLSLHLSVAAASPQSLDSLSRRMSATLAMPTTGPEERGHLRNLILHSKHPELVPTALQLFRALPWRESPSGLAEWLFDTVAAGQVNEIALRYLLEGVPNYAAYIFEEWKQRKISLTGLELDRLAAADDLRLKILLLAGYGDRLDPKWRSDLLAQITHLHSLPASGELAESLAQLDAKEFAIRERASARLAKYGGFIEPALRDGLKSSKSAEASRRIQKLLDHSAEETEWYNTIRTLLFLHDSPQADARKLVRFLRDPTTPQSAITEQIKQIAEREHR